MSGLQDIKKRIRSVQSTHKLISAMQLIAASRFRQSIKLLQNARSYEDSLSDVLYRVVTINKEKYNKARQCLPWYLKEKDASKPHLICVFGAQKGLCGGYNLSSIKEALAVEERYNDRRCLFAPITLKAAEYFIKRKPTQIKHFAGLGHLTDTHYMDLATNVFNDINELFNNSEIGSISIVSGKFVNTLTQRIESYELFPFDITSKLQKQQNAQQTDYLSKQCLVEPSIEKALQRGLEHLVLVHIYRAFIESETCENASRMTMMDNSKRNAKELISKLSVRYNRTRQANITNELIEIIAGVADR
ncbi:MAG: ATP synthase F1 subunit gamma [Holosporales bacterium]|jgi:F-type H+-transporting ATPase subunit gamma|nr:ATP synthase F1 subunit gamma [Holosporales bacterium]